MVNNSAGAPQVSIAPCLFLFYSIFVFFFLKKKCIARWLPSPLPSGSTDRPAGVLSILANGRRWNEVGTTLIEIKSRIGINSPVVCHGAIRRCTE